MFGEKRSNGLFADASELLSLMIECGGFGVWEWSAATDEISFDERLGAMLGYPVEKGKCGYVSLSGLLQPEDQGFMQSCLDEMLKNGKPFCAKELRVRIKDGGWKWISMCSRITGQNKTDEPVRLAGVSRDITDEVKEKQKQQKYHERMEHAQRLESLGNLAAGMASNFNTMLMTILGNVDMALDVMSLVTPGRDYIAEIRMAAKHGAELCREMLSYSGLRELTLDQMDLNQEIQAMSHLFDITIAERIVLNYDLTENLPAIAAEQTKIRQVMMSLITNASESIGRKSGVISISTGAMECDRAYLTETYLDENLPEGIYVYVEVADTGCGIEPDVKNKIFDPFFSTKFTGRGLGLAAVLGIIRGHRGAVKVYTEPGRGTAIKALFPLREQAAETVGAKDVVEEWRSSGTVLVVDDEETVRTLTKRMLERMGFDVLLARDGQEAMDIFSARRDEIACVLLDLTMPRMDGEETFREMRRLQPGLKVILCSGYNQQDITQRFVGRGLAGFLQKPYRSPQLAALMQKLLEGPPEA